MCADAEPVIAIDIALDPDATMMERARAANARLRSSYTEGFAFDATHRPHITLLQQFVPTKNLDEVYAAANAALAKERPASWTLNAIKYYYGPGLPVGSAGITIKRSADLLSLQRALIAAVAPYNLKAGTPAAFYSDDDGRDITEFVLGYVANFATVAADDKFSPHVTIGVGRQSDVAAMLAEPFETFTFSPAGAAVYQLGAFGTARRELWRLQLAI
jgi:2'-5' RNA ligase